MVLGVAAEVVAAALSMTSPQRLSLQQQEEGEEVASIPEEMVRVSPREAEEVELELVREVQMEQEDRAPHRPVAMLMLEAVLGF
jgi:hypothetical protein